MTPPPEVPSFADELAELELAARMREAPETLPLAGELAALGQAARRLGDDDLADAILGAVGLAKLGHSRAITHLAALFAAASTFRRNGSGGAGVLMETVRVLLDCVSQLVPRSLREMTMDEVVQALGRQAAELDRRDGELVALRIELAKEKHARGVAEHARGVAELARARAERMAADLAEHGSPSSPRSPSSRSPSPPSAAVPASS